MKNVMELFEVVKAAGGCKRVDRYALLELCVPRMNLAYEAAVEGGLSNRPHEDGLGRIVNDVIKSAHLACDWRPNVFQIVRAI